MVDELDDSGHVDMLVSSLHKYTVGASNVHELSDITRDLEALYDTYQFNEEVKSDIDAVRHSVVAMDEANKRDDHPAAEEARRKALIACDQLRSVLGTN
jgi:hypothetical protein